MHPELQQLAAYLDGAVDAEARAALRAHILTCAACAARLERLRTDAQRIPSALASGAPAPDLRAVVRRRLRQPPAAGWLGRGLALAGALVALLLFALLIGVRGGGTAGRAADRLFVIDRSNAQLLSIDPRTGARLDTLTLSASPASLVYDSTRARLYVLLDQSIVAIDPQSLQQLARWDAARPLSAAMALDARRGLLYVVQPEAIVALTLDDTALVPARSYPLSRAPDALALAPDGATLFALDGEQARLWTIDIASGSARAQTLAAERSRSAYLKLSRDGSFVYVLLTAAGPGGSQPALWRIDRAGQAAAPALLDPAPPPWDLELLDNGQLAIPRGDGRTGGIELIDSATLTPSAHLDPSYDQHHVVVGADGVLFGLNYTRNTLTRFDAGTHALLWRTPADRSFAPWDGVFVPGGWRWPWQE